MLSELSQRKTNTVWSHLHVESSKAKFVETESRMVVARGSGNGVILVKGYKLPLKRWISSGYLMYTVIIVNSTVVYTWKLLRV